MARTKQTARRWMGGKSPRQSLPTRRDREVLDRRLANRATIRLQSLVRGYMLRKKKVMATRIQSFVRGCIVRKASTKRAMDSDENARPVKRARSNAAVASENAAIVALSAAKSASVAVEQIAL